MRNPGARTHATRNPGAASRFTFHVSRFYLLSLVFFALGLMSKPMLVTLPFVLLLLDYWPLGRLSFPTLQHSTTPPLRLLLEKLPFFALAAASCLVTVLVQKQAMQPLANLSLGARAGNALVACARYLGKTFWPFNLATPYPHPGHWPLGFVLLAAVLVAAVTAGVVWLSLKRARGRVGQTSGLPVAEPPVSHTGGHPEDGLTGRPEVCPTGVEHGAAGSERRTSNLEPPDSSLAPLASPLFVGWFWFLGMLAPVIGLVQVGEQSMADRYTYLPLIGVFIIVVWGFSSLMSKVQSLKSRRLWTLDARPGALPAAPRESRSSAPCNPCNSFNSCNLVNSFAATLAVLVLLACALRTRDQLRHWQNSESLYRHALAVSSKNFIACYNLGSWLDSEGRTDEALTYYFKAVEMQPRYPDPLNNIGCILVGRKQFAEAVPYFEAALRSRPDYVGAHENLAAAFRELGRFQEAIPHLRTVVKEKPQDTGALNSLGNALAGQGQFAEAVTYYETSVRVKPDQFAGHYGLANALSKLGRADEAVAHYRLALQAKPDFAQAHQ